MTIVPFASTNASRAFAASALPTAPVTSDAPTGFGRLWQALHGKH